MVVYAFTFLSDKDQQWFLIVLFLIMTSLTFERYIYLQSYFNKTI